MRSTEMTGFSKLGLFLLIPFTLSLLCLAAKLLYLLRRNQQPETAADAELGSSSAQIKTSTPLHFLCCKSKSRVEPAVASAEDSPALCSSSAVEQEKNLAPVEDGECSLARWREAAFGPSRALFTIREEEMEGTDSDGERTADRVSGCSASTGRVGSGRHGNAVLKEEAVEALFSTPCGTPPFCTPVSSPSRASENE